MAMLDRKNVQISISGRQSREDEGIGLVEMVTQGHMCAGADGAVDIIYEETAQEGMGTVWTVIRVEGAKVSLMRGGAAAAQMVFEKGQRHLLCLDTADGMLTVGVTASQLAADITDAGGSIELTYDVEIGHTMAEENYVRIDIRETDGAPMLPLDMRPILYDKYVN